MASEDDLRRVSWTSSRGRPSRSLCHAWSMATRGRPPLLSNETILDAALAAFAANGYAATSVRALNASLGLSHEAITQRFGAKPDLFRAAVAHGFEMFIVEFDEEVSASDASDDLGQLRAIVRAFIIATSHHPTLGELLHREEFSSEDREALVTSVGMIERMATVAALLDRLHSQGLIEETPLRQLWFLAQSGAAQLHFPGIAGMFDPFDGPVDRDQTIESMTDAIMRSMGVTGGR